MLTLVVFKDGAIRQLNVNTIFINGNIEEKVHMTQFTGFEYAYFPHYVCKLRNTLYDIKQALRA